MQSPHFLLKPLPQHIDEEKSGDAGHQAQGVATHRVRQPQGRAQQRCRPVAESGRYYAEASVLVASESHFRHNSRSIR